MPKVAKLDYQYWISHALETLGDPSTVVSITDHINLWNPNVQIQAGSVYNYLAIQRKKESGVRFLISGVQPRIGRQRQPQQLWWFAEQVTNPLPPRRTYRSRKALREVVLPTLADTHLRRLAREELDIKSTELKEAMITQVLQRVVLNPDFNDTEIGKLVRHLLKS